LKWGSGTTFSCCDLQLMKGAQWSLNGDATFSENLSPV